MCKKACGGHGRCHFANFVIGFMSISGLPEIVSSATALATLEGENYVLWQQVGSHLLKCVGQLRKGEPVDSRMLYLAEAHGSQEYDVRQAHGSDFLNAKVQLSIYRHRAVKSINTAHTAVRSSSKSPADGWNEHVISVLSASHTHIEYMVLLFSTIRYKFFLRHPRRLHLSLLIFALYSHCPPSQAWAR